MDCLENRATIEVWRQSLQGYQRTAWNHPTTVLRHWKKHLAHEQEKTRIAAGSEPKPKPPSPMAKRDEAIRNLVDEVDRLRKAPREGDLFKWGDGHERIAKVLVADALANGGEDSIAELCRREGIVQNLYYRWSKEFLEAGKKRLAGDTARAATSDEVKALRQEASALKEVEAELTLENRLLKKSAIGVGEDGA